MRPSSQKHDLGNRRWLVEFSFRFADAHQRSAIDKLGILAHEVVRLWVDVISPGACVLEPQGTPIRHVAFPLRSGARRFKQTWGGKIVLKGADDT